MPVASQPARRAADLSTVMHALSDPCRISIMRQLLEAKGRALACKQFKLKVSKATCSHHFAVLREAGLIAKKMDGTKCMTSLRKTELNRLYPGLLKLIAHQK